VDDFADPIKPLELSQLDGWLDLGVVAHRSTNDGISSVISQGYLFIRPLSWEILISIIIHYM
tara:strand:- start:283 stop:468 length:186 start_codon:yes stop_codon:yes gene_type:complete